MKFVCQVMVYQGIVCQVMVGHVIMCILLSLHYVDEPIRRQRFISIYMLTDL